MASKRPGRGAVLFGLLVLLAGLAGAVVLFLLASRRDDDAIRDLARAPVGCETLMSFNDTGTFFVYIEHLGTLETLEGSCSDVPEEYSRAADDEPVVEITLLDGDRNVLEFDRVEDEFTYSLDDAFAGTAKRQVEIESPGNYVVTVDSTDNDFVVAVGRDPASAGNSMRLGALASGIAGIVLGLALVLLGVRRGRRARRVATAYVATPGGWPVGAPTPTAPPLMQPPSTQPMPAPQNPGEWAPVLPVGPPVGPPVHYRPTSTYVPADQPAPGPLAPPRVFAPPAMPTVPGGSPTDPVAPPAPSAPQDPYAPRLPRTDGAPTDDRGDAEGGFRGDASR